VEFDIRSTTTGDTLWGSYGKVEVDTSSDDKNIISALIQTAITTAQTDYIPIAQRVNTLVLQNVPVGQYHPRFNEDGDDEIEDETPGQRRFMFKD
jgi:predicted ATPase